MPTKQFVAAPADLTKADVCLRSDMSYWTCVLGVSEFELGKAATTVGSASRDVRAEIRRYRRK